MLERYTSYSNRVFTACYNLNPLHLEAFCSSCLRRSHADGRTMGDAGAFGGTVPSEGQDPTAGSAPDTGCHILWRHENGAQWRAFPAELGPWWRAAQTFIRWARLGVWERLLNLVQERGIQLGMTFLDGTSVRAHQKAAGARRQGALKLNETSVKPLVALVAAMAPRLA